MSGRRKDNKPPPRSSTPGPAGKKITTLNPFAKGGILRRSQTPMPQSSQGTPVEDRRSYTPVPLPPAVGYYTLPQGEDPPYSNNVMHRAAGPSTPSTSQATQYGPLPPPARTPSTPPVDHPPAVPGGPARSRRQSEHGGGRHGRSGSHHASNLQDVPPVPALPENLPSPGRAQNISVVGGAVAAPQQHPYPSSTQRHPSSRQTRPTDTTPASGTEQTQAGTSIRAPRARATTLVPTTRSTGTSRLPPPIPGSSRAAGTSTGSGSRDPGGTPSQPLAGPVALHHVHLFTSLGGTIYQLHEDYAWEYSVNSWIAAKSFEIEEYDKILRSAPRHGLHARILPLERLTISYTLLTTEVLNHLKQLESLQVLAFDQCRVRSPATHPSWETYKYMLPKPTSWIHSFRIFNLKFEPEGANPLEPYDWGLSSLILFLRRFCGDSLRSFDFSAPRLLVQDESGQVPSIEAPHEDLAELLLACIPETLIRLRVRHQTDVTTDWLTIVLEKLVSLRVLMLEDQGNLRTQKLHLSAKALPQITHFVGNFTNFGEMSSLKSLRCICIQTSRRGTAAQRKVSLDMLFAALPELRTVIFYISQWDKETTVFDVLPPIDPAVQVSNYRQGFDAASWDVLLRQEPQDVRYWSRYPRTITNVRADQVTNYIARTGGAASITHQVIEKCGNAILREEPWVYDSMKTRQLALEDRCASEIWGGRAIRVKGSREPLRVAGVTNRAYL